MANHGVREGRQGQGIGVRSRYQFGPGRRNVFSWLRSGDGTQARNIGIKYDCRAQTLQIQLIYQCKGSQGCALDPNIDKYAGKILPATDIKSSFKEACER